MIGNVANAGQALTLLQTGTGNRRAALAKAAESLAPKDKAALEQNQRELEALDNLTRTTAEMKRQRKGEAAEKVKRLKKELQQLRMMGGDPKVVARQAARIARELSSAVKEYGAANDGKALTGEAAVTGPQGAGAQTNTAATAQPTPTAPDAGVAKETAAPVAVQTEAPTVPDEPGGEGEPGEKGDGEKGDGETGQIAQAPADKNSQAFKDKVQAEVGEIQKRDAEKQADLEFVRDVRQVLAGVKALMERQKARAAEEGQGPDPEMDQLGNSVKNAAATIERILTSGLGSGMFVAPLPVNVVV